MNRITIIGNLVKDPNKSITREGVSVCNFTVAVNRRHQNAQAGQPDADFFRVTAWRGLADICGNYLAKGRKVAVTGSVSIGTYTASNGTTRANLEVTADDVEFLTPKGEYAPGTVGAIDQQQKKGGFVQVDDDELPWS